MTEKFHELYQQISEVENEGDYYRMWNKIAEQRDELHNITTKDMVVLHKCLDAYAEAMGII